MFYTKTFVNSWIGLLKTRLLIVIIDGRPCDPVKIPILMLTHAGIPGQVKRIVQSPFGVVALGTAPWILLP